jgi:hypothetical protein
MRTNLQDDACGCLHVRSAPPPQLATRTRHGCEELVRPLKCRHLPAKTSTTGLRACAGGMEGIGHDESAAVQLY